MSEPHLSLTAATATLTSAGQLFETERQVVRGIEMSVWKHAPGNLREVLNLSLRHGEREFLIYGSQRITFDEHFRIAATLSHRLRDGGVQAGDRVAIASRNLPSWVSAFWGIVSAGAIAVPLNAWWTTEELRYGLADSGTRVAFVDEERLDRVWPLLDELDHLTTVVVMSDVPGQVRALSPHTRVQILSFDEYLGSVDQAITPVDIAIDADDDATMFYTSGTTGHPKGAIGTHRNVVTNLMNLFFIGQRSTLRLGDDGDHAIPAGPSANLLNIPLFHATGCLAVMVVCTASGGKLVMTHHFDPGEALAIIERERITTIGGVPTVVMQILDHPDFSNYDVSSVRLVSYGGAPAPPELVRRIRSAFNLAQPGNGYGLTETAAAVALNTGPDYVERPTSCGTVVPVCEVAVVPDGYEGEEPPTMNDPGVVGELWIKGPNVVRGYWNKPEETARSFTAGWLHTGDVARIDEEGFIYIVDRAKDVIIRGGENVYSVIVEAALFEHPDVADCAVIGLPHPTLGEEVAAVVVLRPGRQIRAEELSKHVTHRLARFEIPTKYFFRGEPLPRNPQGKVLKRALREALLRVSSD